MSRLPISKVGNQQRQEQQRSVGEGIRSWVLLALVSTLLLGAMGTRLAYLQIVEGAHNRELADENRIRLIPKPPERGKILDRKGRVLADNTFSYSLFLWPIAKTEAEWPRTLEIVAQTLKIPLNELQNRLEQAGYRSRSRVRIAKGLTSAQVVALEERETELVGVQVDRDAIRNYPNGVMAAHVIGYIGELTKEELDAKSDQGYRMGDVIGQSGVEYSYESHLRGTWGGQQVEVDGAGKVLRILGEKPSTPGRNLYLTLDLDVQRAAEKALGSRPGAIVAMDPRNGAILAMASWPAYNPNWFSRRMTQAQWNQLQRLPFPFVNRALQGFPPASTFKIVTATAGLESGKYNPNTILMSYGVLNLGGLNFHDWNDAGFGAIGFPTALAWSSNTFFGQVALGAGATTLIDWTRRYGFGQKTGIDLPSEAAGLVPDDAWKRRVFKEPWYPADTVIMAVGQGALQASPLQVATMFAVPANGGYHLRPHVIQDGRRNDQWRQSMGLKPSTVQVLRQGLRQVVTSGTGGRLNVPDLPPIAGKSGTGEDPPRPHHTWFGAYAPADKPEIVVVAFAENSGGGGGSTCGPMALEVLRAYFKANPQKNSQQNSLNVNPPAASR